MDAPLSGVVPVVPTIFHDDETVDLDGTARVVDYLIDAGVDGLCLLANYSEQFSLTDAERDAIARRAARARRGTAAGDRHHQPLQRPGRRRAQPRRAGHGRGDGDAHAAVLRRHAHRARARA